MEDIVATVVALTKQVSALPVNSTLNVDKTMAKKTKLLDTDFSTSDDKAIKKIQKKLCNKAFDKIIALSKYTNPVNAKTLESLKT